MATQAFTANEAIHYGWKTVTGRFWYFASIFLSLWVVQFLTSKIAGSFNESQEALITLVMLVSWILQIGLYLGAYSIALQTVAGKKPKYDELFSKFNASLMFRYFLTSLLVGVICTIGFFLLIIPGFIFGIRLGFFSYILLDKKLGPVESVKASWNLTKGHMKELITLMLFMIGINLLGFAAFGVGLLLTMPLSLLASTYAYHKLATK